VGKREYPFRAIIDAKHRMDALFCSGALPGSASTGVTSDPLACFGRTGDTGNVSGAGDQIAHLDAHGVCPPLPWGVDTSPTRQCKGVFSNSKKHLAFDIDGIN